MWDVRFGLGGKSDLIKDKATPFAGVAFTARGLPAFPRLFLS